MPENKNCQRFCKPPIRLADPLWENVPDQKGREKSGLFCPNESDGTVVSVGSNTYGQCGKWLDGYQTPQRNKPGVGANSHARADLHSEQPLLSSIFSRNALTDSFSKIPDARNKE